ncbi:MAG: 30S ribosome-binding factor RbfA [Sinobacteraceae bacterium]|nr:30S ribosome-binding factor RbfA [Nevskiaceae bacterium]
MPSEYPRRLRVESQLQRELSQLLQREIADPRAQGATITHTKVSPDLRNATVYLNELGSDGQLQQAVQALQHAEPRLRHLLGQRLRLRRVPALRFMADQAQREGDHVVDLIRAAVRADEQVHQNNPDSEPVSDDSDNTPGAGH